MTDNNVTDGSRSERTMNHYPLLAIGGTVLALAGFAVGRAYPAHSYQQIGTSSYLFDTHTGKVCAPFRDSQVAADTANMQGIDPDSPMGHAMSEQAAKEQPLEPNDPWAIRARQLKHKVASDMVPACGRE